MNITGEQLDQLIREHFGEHLLERMENLQKRWKAFAQRKHLTEVEKYHEWRRNSVVTPAAPPSHAPPHSSDPGADPGADALPSMRVAATETASVAMAADLGALQGANRDSHAQSPRSPLDTLTSHQRDIRDILALDSPKGYQGFGYGIRRKGADPAGASKPLTGKSSEEVRQLKRIDNALWRAWSRHRRAVQQQSSMAGGSAAASMSSGAGAAMDSAGLASVWAAATTNSTNTIPATVDLGSDALFGNMDSDALEALLQMNPSELLDLGQVDVLASHWLPIDFEPALTADSASSFRLKQMSTAEANASRTHQHGDPMQTSSAMEGVHALSLPSTAAASMVDQKPPSFPPNSSGSQPKLKLSMPSGATPAPGGQSRKASLTKRKSSQDAASASGGAEGAYTQQQQAPVSAPPSYASQGPFFSSHTPQLPFAATTASATAAKQSVAASSVWDGEDEDEDDDFDMQDPSLFNDKRTAHIAAEQKRRQNINLGFEELQNLLPVTQRRVGIQKFSKATTLSKAIEYINYLVRQKSSISEEVAMLRQEAMALAVVNLRYQQFAQSQVQASASQQNPVVVAPVAAAAVAAAGAAAAAAMAAMNAGVPPVEVLNSGTALNPFLVSGLQGMISQASHPSSSTQSSASSASPPLIRSQAPSLILSSPWLPGQPSLQPVSSVLATGGEQSTLSPRASRSLSPPSSSSSSSSSSNSSPALAPFASALPAPQATSSTPAPSAQPAQASLSQSQLSQHLIKFQLFRLIIEKLFQSFNSMVSLTSFDSMSATTLAWMEENCRPQRLQEISLSALQSVGSEFFVMGSSVLPRLSLQPGVLPPPSSASSLESAPPRGRKAAQRSLSSGSRKKSNV